MTHCLLFLQTNYFDAIGNDLSFLLYFFARVLDFGEGGGVLVKGGVGATASGESAALRLRNGV